MRVVSQSGEIARQVLKIKKIANINWIYKVDIILLSIIWDFLFVASRFSKYNILLRYYLKKVPGYYLRNKIVQCFWGFQNWIVIRDDFECEKSEQQSNVVLGSWLLVFRFYFFIFLNLENKTLFLFTSGIYPLMKVVDKNSCYLFG